MDKIIEQLERLIELLKGSDPALTEGVSTEGEPRTEGVSATKVPHTEGAPAEGSNHANTKAWCAPIEEMIEEVHSIITQLLFDNVYAINKLSYLLDERYSIPRIALANAWTKELKEISDNISALLKKQAEEGGFLGQNPSDLTIDNEKWNDIKRIHGLSGKDLLLLNAKRRYVQQYFKYGNVQPAIVMVTFPLIISAYSDSLDAVVMLKFPAEYAKKYNLKQFDRLLTVNGYLRAPKIPTDIDVGHYFSQSDFTDFLPLIVEFLSSDTRSIDILKWTIPEEVWRRARLMSDKYLRRHDERRNGFYFLEKGYIL